MTNEVETNALESVAQELKLNGLDAGTGGVAASPDNSGAGRPVWAGEISPGLVK